MAVPLLSRKIVKKRVKKFKRPQSDGKISGKPASGMLVPGKDGVTCQFSADPTVALGYLSVAFLIASTVAGYLSLIYPYKRKSVPRGFLFKIHIALFTTGLAAMMLLWPTITES